jgi:PAS domain-containing protein
MLPAADQLTELLAAIYDAAGDVPLWDEFLRKLAHTTRADSAALIIHQSGHEQHTVVAGWKLDPKDARLYREYYGTRDVWAQQPQVKRAGYVGTSEGLCHRSVLESSEFYNDFLVRQRINHALFATFENTARRFSAVSLFRNASSGEFEEDADLQVVRLIVPHVQRAFGLHFRLSELKARSEGIETALNMLPTAVIFLKSNGELAVVNRQAEELLRQGDGLLLENGKLSAALSAEAKRLQNLIHGAEQTRACFKNTSGA